LNSLMPFRCGRKDAADWTGIGGAVGMASDMAEDGTDIQARAAANAVQHFALLGVGEQRTASVIDQHHVELFRSIGFAGSSRPPISVL